MFKSNKAGTGFWHKYNNVENKNVFQKKKKNSTKIDRTLQKYKKCITKSSWIGLNLIKLLGAYLGA